MRSQTDDGLFEHAPPRAAPTLVRLSTSQSSVPKGGALELRAEVRTVHGDGPAATGSVQFRAEGRLLGSAPLNEQGRALLHVGSLNPGVHALTATYDGDAEHAAASSGPLPQAVIAPGTPVVVLVSPPVDTPDGIALDAEVVDPTTGRLAEDARGAVVFSIGPSLVATVDLVAGHARAVVAGLPAGRLRAAFSGDAEHAPASGSVLDAASGA